MIPDRDEDIKPRFHKSKVAAGQVNGDVSSGLFFQVIEAIIMDLRICDSNHMLPFLF